MLVVCHYILARLRTNCGALCVLALLALAPELGSAQDTALFPESPAPGSRTHAAHDNSSGSAKAVGENGWPTDTRSDLSRPGSDWFPKNSVTDLNDNPSLQDQSDLKFFLDKRDYTPPAQQQAANQAEPKDISPQGVIEKFGDPDQDAPLEPLADSPKPLQAVMLALNAEDPELAYKYARQYVRRLRKLQSQSDRIVSLIGVAREREGMMDEQTARTWASTPEDRALLAADREREKALLDENAGLAELDERARALIARAQESEDIGNLDTVKKAAPSNTAPDAATAQRQIQALRAKFRGKITPDPSGRVQVLFFFRTTDKVSAENARNLERVYRQYAEDNRVNFLGLLLGDENPEAVRTFRRYTKASFEFKPGANLAKVMGVSATPTVAFVVPSSGKATLMSGGMSQVQLSEMVSIMQGR